MENSGGNKSYSSLSFLFSFFDFLSLPFDSEEVSPSSCASRFLFFFLSLDSLLLTVTLTYSLLEDVLDTEDVYTIALPKTALSSAAVLFFKSFAAECFLYLR
jgi:hypothetical protein